ncbi:MAG: hypothetical protein IMX05_01470 [Hydrogenibacillus schlegelii]|nr:hypothetical protein [Hydrogenibacillus schlegelii]
MAIRYRAYDSALYVKDASGAWKQFAYVETISPPKIETDEIEATALGGDGFKVTMPGLSDAGDVQFTLFMSGTGDEFKEMLSYALDLSVRDWLVVLGDSGLAAQFKGWVKSFNIAELSANEVIKAETSIRVVGAWQLVNNPLAAPAGTV